jgi:hypothetical protein
MTSMQSLVLGKKLYKMILDKDVSDAFFLMYNSFFYYLLFRIE